ncbi:MAG: cytochrome b N-terminal domain-containing protein [Armatimonadetes bacterium]|nr:cytochrome b N-terminal domain-containing protein [Armatimonadota bacterium]
MLKRIYDWTDERTGLVSMAEEEMHKPLPPGVGWPFSLGSAILFLVIVQFVTGFTLATLYAPTPDHAYASIQYLERNVPYGRIVRGLHHWTASVVVIVMFLHLLRTLIYGAYKRPREMTWMFGVGLFFVMLGFAFTGYLLPWDQKSYWGTVVGTEIAASVPLVGEYVLRLMRGSNDVGALTLSRFYAVHVMLLPWLLIGLLSGHLFLVRKLGTAGPWAEHQGENARPNPFYPNQVFKDMVVAVGIGAFVLYMAIQVGAPLEPVANPAATDYIPRPEWYFLSLYQLLKYLPGRLEVVGTFILPTLGGIALFFLPFLDRSPERHPLKRPWVVGIAGVTTLGIAILTAVAMFTNPKQPGAETPVADPTMTGPVTAAADPVRGKKLYEDFACGSCHVISGQGNAVGPELTHVGSQRDAAYLKKKTINPKFDNPESIMPPTQAPPKDIDDLVAYMESLK